MIARIWHGRVRRADAEAYHQYLLETGLADYARTEGNRGVELLRRDEGDITHFLTLTYWDSIEAIQGFAGEDYGKARYYAADDQYLLEREMMVSHYEVVSTTGRSSTEGVR